MRKNESSVLRFVNRALLNAVLLLGAALLVAILPSTAKAQEREPRFLDDDQKMELLQEGKGWQRVKISDPEGRASVPDEEIFIVTAEGIDHLPVTQAQKDELRDDFGLTGTPQPSDEAATEVIVMHKLIAEYVETGELPPGYEGYAETEGTKGCFGWNDKEKTENWSFSEWTQQRDFDLFGGSVDGNFSVNIPFDGQATLNLKYRVKKFACAPYKFKFKEARIFGDASLAGDSDLEAQVTLTGQWSKEWQLINPHIGRISFWVGPIPVWIDFNLPVHAGLELETALTGTIGVNTDMSAAGSFDYTCNTSSCSGWNTFDDQFSTNAVTGSVEVDIKGRAHARVMVRAEVYDDSVIYVQAGAKGFVEADLWGYYGNDCGDGDGDGQNETVEALVVDAFAGYDIVYGIGGALLPDRDWTSTGDRFPLGWWDLLGSGGSTALAPMVHGPGSVLVGQPQQYTVKMRPCYPYPDRVNLRITPDPSLWAGTTYIDKPKDADPTKNSTTFTRTFNAARNYNVHVKALTDAKGRSIQVDQTRFLQVVAPVQAPQITQHPQSQTVSVGSTVFMTVQASGTSPSYRWYRDGVALNNGGKFSGVTTSQLRITGADNTVTGSYHARAWNSQGSVDSNSATLAVFSNPQSLTVDVDPSQPNYLSVSGSSNVLASYSPAGSVNELGGAASNTDDKWSAWSDMWGNTGLDVITEHLDEDAPPMTISLDNLQDGTSYVVYGRYATANSSTAVNYGLAMGLSAASLTTFDENSTGTVKLQDWGIWEEHEVCLGTTTVSGNRLNLYFDAPAAMTRASFAGLRAVQGSACPAAPQQVTVTVAPGQPTYLSVSGASGVGASITPMAEVNQLPPGVAGNSDDKWSATVDLHGHAGLDVVTGYGDETLAPLTVSVSGLQDGISYAVHGRFATAIGPSTPYGVAMGLSSAGLVTYDQNSGAAKLRDWGIWEEHEACLGQATVSSGQIQLFLDDPAGMTRSSFSGLRLVKGGSC